MDDDPVEEILGREAKPLKLVWWAGVGAVWLVADGVMAARELVARRRQRRRLTVTYDAAGRIVSFHVPVRS